MMGERLGLVKVTSINDESCQGMILRGYPRIEVNHYARERFGSDEDADIFIMSYHTASDATTWGYMKELSTYNPLSFALSLRLGIGYDSRGDEVLVAGLNLLFSRKFYRSHLLDAGYDFGGGFFFAGGPKDDSGHEIMSSKWPVQFGGLANIYLTETLVLYGRASLHLSGKIRGSDWKWSEKKDTDGEEEVWHRAVWDPNLKPRQFNLSGFSLSLGVKFVL